MLFGFIFLVFFNAANHVILPFGRRGVVFIRYLVQNVVKVIDRVDNLPNVRFLQSRDGRISKSVDFEPCADWPTSEWGPDGVARGHGTLRVDPFIEGGTYTVTVGLVDPVTGARAGQPLSIGQVEVQTVEGKVVSDEITLPVSDVPPGVYRVAIGVYDPETGARLPVTASTPSATSTPSTTATLSTSTAGTGTADDQYLLVERLVLP